MTSSINPTGQIIIIGDELLNGTIQDANIAPLAKWMRSRGIALKKTLIVRDERSELSKAIASAWSESDLVITTGGLGPTKDDITKSLLAEFVGGQLVENQEAIGLVSAQYDRINKEWKKDTNLYHLIPEGVKVFKNPMGLAPGLMIEKEGKVLLATPGVPRELRAMIDTEFDSLLNSSLDTLAKNEHQISIRTKGIPEEKIFFELMPNLWKELEEFGKVSSLPQLLGVDINIQISGTIEQAREAEATLKAKLASSHLAPHIWHWGDGLIEEIIVKRATQKEVTIGFAESCTGGMLANRITNISGSSKVFFGSLVTYDNSAKERILKVSPVEIEEFGAVSAEVAKQMAIGAKDALQTDIAISLTGIAGPGGGSKEKPVGTVCMGYAAQGESDGLRFNFFGDREQLKSRFTQAAMFKVLELIETF